MIFYKHIWWWPWAYDEFKECETKIKFEIVKGMKSIHVQKPNLAIYFWAFLLTISIKEMTLIFYIWVLNTTNRGHHEYI